MFLLDSYVLFLLDSAALWCPTQPRSSGAHPLMSFSDTLHVPAVLPALQLASQQRYSSEWLPTKFQQHPNGWLPIKFHQCPAGDLPESFSSAPMTAFHKVPRAPQQTASLWASISTPVGGFLIASLSLWNLSKLLCRPVCHCSTLSNEIKITALEGVRYSSSDTLPSSLKVMIAPFIYHSSMLGFSLPFSR